MLQTVLCTAVPAPPHGNGSAVFARPATAPAVAMYTQDLTAMRQLAALPDTTSSPTVERISMQTSTS